MDGNLLAPDKEGQLRAMRAAYAQAGWDPRDVGLIECHATGTPVGDAVEFDSLRELWGDSGWAPGQCAIGSVKSTVGHLLTGAGAAATAKVLLAFANKQRPPQANFAGPGPELRYAGGPFRVLPTAEPWEDAAGHAAAGGRQRVRVRRGERAPAPGGVRRPDALLTPSPRRSVATGGGFEAAPPEPVAVVGMAAHFGPWDDLRKYQEYVLGGGERPDPTPKRNGWGQADRDCPPGYFIEGLTVPLDRFRIPPKELEEMLPQQLLTLQVAAAALDDSGDRAMSPDPRTGVFVGLGLDLNTTNFHLRWAAKASLPPPPGGEGRVGGTALTNPGIVPHPWSFPRPNPRPQGGRDRRLARRRQPAADRRPDDGRAGQHRRQPRRPRLRVRRAELHRLLRGDVRRPGAGAGGAGAAGRRTGPGRRRRGGPGRRPAGAS